MVTDDENLKTRAQRANDYMNETCNLGGQLNWYDRKATAYKFLHKGILSYVRLKRHFKSRFWSKRHFLDSLHYIAEI